MIEINTAQKRLKNIQRDLDNDYIYGTTRKASKKAKMNNLDKALEGLLHDIRKEETTDNGE